MARMRPVSTSRITAAAASLSRSARSAACWMSRSRVRTTLSPGTGSRADGTVDQIADVDAGQGAVAPVHHLLLEPRLAAQVALHLPLETGAADPVLGR